MGVTEVRQFFEENGVDEPILEFAQSSATVELAAEALGVEPALIAKTLAIWAGETPVVIVTCGDARIDNRKFKNAFGAKAKMMAAAEVQDIVGHPVGGVCPFALRNPVGIYLDVSLKKFDLVYPAAGDENTAVRIAPDTLLELTGATWIDVCRAAG